MTRSHLFVAFAALLVSLHAYPAHEPFHQDQANPKSGFMPAKDPLYVKECGACHFAYSPGLLPARSWNLHIDRLEKHFGESVNLPAATKDALRKYLTDNAADKSDYEGSVEFNRLLKADTTPFIFQHVPRYRQAHAVIMETIKVQHKVRVKSLTNCNSCHELAAEGSFANSELVIPGLRGPKRNAN